ncbi:hypothetical protein HDU98_008118 [Podochytrium sp. JEL0797]|nr:hypothetical protein HDU98_008118 [Podochytrium sp. JEL0797]
MPTSTWTAFEELQGLITLAYRSSAPGLLKQLEFKLQQLRPAMQNLLASEAKDAATRKGIEEGRATLGNATQHFNASFAKQALLVSDTLGTSETAAVALVGHVLQGAAQRLDRAPLAAAVLEFAREHQCVLECLDLMQKAVCLDKVPLQARRLLRHHLDQLADLPSVLAARLASTKHHIDALRDDVPNDAFLTGAQLKANGLTEDIIALAVEQLAKLRVAQCGLLLSFALYDKLSHQHVLLLLKTVQTSNASDPIWAPLATTLLAGIQSLDRDSELTADQVKCVSEMSSLISNEPAKWVLKDLQSAVMIQFSIYLKCVRAKNPLLEDTLGFRDSIETRVSNCLASGPFKFINEAMISWATLESSSPVVDGDVEVEIRECSFSVLQRFVSDFFRVMGRVVRTLKNEAEDLEAVADAAKPASNSSLKHLLNLVYILYRDRPDDGYVYWTDPDLFKFLRFMTDIRSSTIFQSYLDILSSFATGPKSSQCAFEFLGSNHPRLSWEALFRSLDLTAKSLASLPDGEMHPAEVETQRSFLRLLKQVIKFSEIARSTLYTSAHLQVINTLFNLLNRRISVDLKASLFDAIAAFCIPVEKGCVSEVAPMVWRHLEQSEIVSRPTYSSGAVYYGAFNQSSTAGSGIRYDCEQIESLNQTYPETVAFMGLLDILLVALKPNQMTGALDGFSTRLQGAGGVNHYVNYAVEDVFLKVHNRGFTSNDERWRMIELSLLLMDQCLKSFDLTFGPGGAGPNSPAVASLRTEAGGSTETATTVMISSHPGFSLLLRLLSGSPLLKRLLELVSIPVESVNTYARKCASFSSSIKFALRILVRVFHLQQTVSDTLSRDALSSVASTTDPSSPHQPHLHQAPSITGIDQLLAFYKDAVIQLSLYVNCEVDDEICLLSVNLLTLISQSPVFSVVDTGVVSGRGGMGKMNRLVSLLSSSDESHRIVGGYVHRLELEEAENLVDLSGEWETRGETSARGGDGLKVDSWRDPDLAVLLFDSAAPAETLRMESVGLANVVRLAILDLLLVNLLETKGGVPSVAHYLLGYDLRKGGSGKVEIMEAKAQNGRTCCLHIVLDLLRVGTVEKSGGGAGYEAEEATQVPLFESHPKLSERCFRMLYLLCSNEMTSAVTMRFLRTGENFFYRQLEAMPVTSVISAMDSDTEVSLPFKNAHVSTQLHQRSWLMQLIALELHVTTTIGQRTHAQKLLDLLFIRPVPDSVHRFDQPLTKMLEVLNSLDFTTGESSATSQPKLHLTYFNDLDLTPCICTDEYGYTLYDLRAAHSLLLAHQRHLEKHNPAASPQDRTRVKQEIASILQHLLLRNQRIEHLGARIHVAFAWSRITRTAYATPQSFDLLPVETREEKSYQLLTMLFPKLSGGGGGAGGDAVSVSETSSSDIVEYMCAVVLDVVHQLKEDKPHQGLLRAASLARGSGGRGREDEKPVTELRVILKGLVDGILRVDATPSQRENLYSALLYYFGYTAVSGVVGEDGDLKVGSYRARVALMNGKVVSECGERLLEVVCRDAATADRVLKTAAFSVLEALCHLSSQDGASGEGGNAVVTFMVKRNFLAGFVSAIGKQEDAAIQSLMQLDPAPENWPYLYIFESKMSLLLRIAQHRDGIEKLLESGLLEVLIECKFLDERPDLDSDPMESDRSLLETSEIYHMTATPVLELILCIASHGRDNAMLIEQLSLFLYNHQETFISILKNKNAIASAAEMHELELVTAFISYLGSNRQLLETGIRGSGYISFHNLLVSLLAHYSTLEESNCTAAGGAVGGGLWDTRIERHVQAVCRNLLSYCEVVTCPLSDGPPRDTTLSLIFTNLLSGDATTAAQSSSLRGSQKPQEKSRLPVSTLLHALTKFMDRFHRASNECAGLHHKITDVSRLSVDEILEIAKRGEDGSAAGARSGDLDELSTVQRQQVAVVELKKEAKAREGDVGTILQIVDILLLLTWRYFEFCVGPSDANGGGGQTDPNRYMRMGGSSANGHHASAEEKQVSRMRIELGSVVDKVVGLDLTQQEEERGMFVQMVARKLRAFV